MTQVNGKKMTTLEKNAVALFFLQVFSNSINRSNYLDSSRHSHQNSMGAQYRHQIKMVLLGEEFNNNPCILLPTYQQPPRSQIALRSSVLPASTTTQELMIIRGGCWFVESTLLIWSWLRSWCQCEVATMLSTTPNVSFATFAILWI